MPSIISVMKNVILRVSGFSSHMLLRPTIECVFSPWLSTKENSLFLATTNGAPIMVIVHVMDHLTHVLSTIVLGWDTWL